MSDLIEKVEHIIEFGGTYQGVPSNIKDADEIIALVEAETVQRCIDAAKPILHSHIYKGTEETYEELKDAEQELIEALEAQK